jgi:uncharacterized protein with HEPN domain
MYDKVLVREVLHQLCQATETILQRFEPVESVNDFTGSPGGMEKLDSICMLLIAIGEGLKNLDKITDRTLLQRYPQVEWKKAMGLRDIISHHYFDVDAENIFFICTTHLKPMRQTLGLILEELV